MISVVLIAVALSLGASIIAVFIGGDNTLPTFVCGKMHTTLDPTINAIATILILLTMGSTLIALRLSRYRG